MSSCGPKVNTQSLKILPANEGQTMLITHMLLLLNTHYTRAHTQRVDFIEAEYYWEQLWQMHVHCKSVHIPNLTIYSA